MKTKTSLIGMVAALLVFAGTLTASAAAPPDEDISAITRSVYPSVVKVEAHNGWRKVATGVVIDKKGHIVTTALITPRDEAVYVTTTDGKRYEAEFLGMDSVTHLAVIRVAEKGKWTPIEWGRPQDVDAGSWIGVVSISPEETPAVTQGIVSSVGQDSLRLNVWVVPGASGSPVINRKGRLVGLVRGSYAEDIGLSISTRIVQDGWVALNREEAPSSALAMAIPVNIVEKVANEIKEKGKVERGWLGISIARNQAGSVRIALVEEDSPAAEAGLEEGDLIHKFDNLEVMGSNMLTHEIRMRRPGDKVKLVIEREEEEMDITVELGEYSEKSIIAEFQSNFPRLFAVPEKLSPQGPDEPGIFSIVRGGRNFIGVYLQELNPELAEYFGVTGENGLLVTRLSQDGPAEKAGVKVGDVIVKVDGKTIASQADLNREIQRAEKGDAVELSIIRDRKALNIKVEVARDESSGRFISSLTDGLTTRLPDTETLLERVAGADRILRRDVFSDRLKTRVNVTADKVKEIGRRMRETLKERSREAEKFYKNFVSRYRCIKV